MSRKNTMMTGTGTKTGERQNKATDFYGVKMGAGPIKGKGSYGAGAAGYDWYDRAVTNYSRPDGTVDWGAFFADEERRSMKNADGASYLVTNDEMFLKGSRSLSQEVVGNLSDLQG